MQGRPGWRADMGGPRISFPRQHYKGGRGILGLRSPSGIFLLPRAEPRTGKQLTACVWYFCPTGYLKSLSRLGRLKPTQFLSMPSNWLGLCEDYVLSTKISKTFPSKLRISLCECQKAALVFPMFYFLKRRLYGLTGYYCIKQNININVLKFV